MARYQVSVFLGPVSAALEHLRGELSVSHYLRKLVQNEIDRLGGEAAYKIEMAKAKIAKLQAEIEEEEKKKVTV